MRTGVGQPRLRRAAVALVALTLVGALAAACSGSSSSAPATTPTTLSRAQIAVLLPKLLTVGDFPPGWTLSASPNASPTKNAPACVASLVRADGSTSRSIAIFLGPGSSSTAAIQTVAVFPRSALRGTASTFRSDFDSCTASATSGASGSITVTPITGLSTGDGGFVSQLTLSSGASTLYFDAYYATSGGFATFVGWYSTSSSTASFEQVAAKALAKL